MSIRDLFEKPVSIENVSTSSMKVESNEYIIESTKRDKTFQPYVDFSSASNFAKFGSAYEYYTKALERIYGDYPYDGSEKEKTKFEISSSYLDKYIFDKLYPKSTGYINFSYGGWGSGSPDAQGYGSTVASSDYEYIFIRGGIHTASSGMENSPLYKTFDNSVVYDSAASRTSTFTLDPEKGWTVEFWLKKDDFDATKSSREVILDLWNNNSTGGSTYGRFTLSLNGGSALNGLNSFQMTFRSGSLASGKGIFEQTVCSSTFHTSSLATWGHYALSVVSESSGLITRFYTNGDLNQKTTHNVGGAMGSVGGRINGYIGSLIGTTSHLSPSNQYAGKLSASLDDFRFWKARRTSEEVYDNWYVPANGGTNTDDANIDLGLYYKFNEGITGYSSKDSVVLDYSGRIINGSWTGYAAGSRNTGSAFVSSSLVTTEKEDPIVYSTHPTVVNLLSELQTSGSDWDVINPSLLYNTIPQWIRDEDEETNSNVKYLYQIIASHFDTLHSQITALPSLQNRVFPSSSYKALPFAKDMLESKGLVTPNLFVNSNLIEMFGDRDDNQVLFEEKLSEIKNLIYTNIYNNLDFIYKSKGTERSIRNMLRCFGIDDEIVKLNVYTDGGTHYFNDKHKQTSQTTKYINFNSGSLMSATMFLTASDSNSLSYISGSEASKSEQFSAFTAEIDVVVPYKLKMHEKGHFDTSFLSSSIFGMHRPADGGAGTDYTWRPLTEDIGNFQIYLLRDGIESENAQFVLTNRDGSLYLTSSVYNQIYNNQRWNIAVRVKPDKYPLIGNIVSSSNPTYNVELYGVTHDYDDVRSEFTVTSSVSYDSGSAFLSDSKRFYFGSHVENFTGSVLQQTDMKIGAFRFYMDYLEDSIIKQHNLDPSNYGLRKSYQSPTLFSLNLDKQVPSADLIAANHDFSTVTGSNASGQFIVEDLSSGSSDVIYGWIDNINRREHRVLGHGFPASVSTMVDNEPIFSFKKELPEIAFTANNVFIKGDKEESIIKDDDVSDNLYALEKSMGQVVSEEMLKMFSSVKEMNNLVGKAIDRYRIEYKNLNILRRLFFEKNEGDPNFDRFTEYFKWIDVTVSEMVNQLFPISTRHSKGISNIIESHMLERNKYQNKFPLLDIYSATETSIKSYSELNYNWKFGHAPLPDSENDNCLWNKDREVRTDIADRESIRKVILNHNNATALSASTETGVVYEASTYAIRKLAKPYSIETTLGSRIHAGINHPENKDRDFIHNAVSRHGDKTNIGIPKNVVLVGGGTGSGVITKRRCDDIHRPNIKENLNVDAFIGKYAGGGSTPTPTNANETYNYRTDVSKLPLTIVSQSVRSGYGASVLNEYHDVRITNLHSDTTDFTNEIPMQGPFTNTWVGGHQSRHIEVNRYDNTLNDDDSGGAPPNNIHNQYTRPEAWRLLFGERDSGGFTKYDGAFGFTGFDYGGPYPDPARKGATFYRGERAKRPVNIENIKTTTGSISHGSFYQNYELVSAVGKQENNLYFRKNPVQSNYLPTSITASLPTTTHPLTLVAYAATANGNVFGKHSNNRQPDIPAVTGATASAEFNAYGTSGSNEYSLINTWLEQAGKNHGILIEDVGISIGVSGSAAYSGDFDTVAKPTGSSVEYWNELNRLLTAVPAITSTYSIVNAVDNYSQGFTCHSINGQNVALSSSTLVGASGSAAFTFSSWINVSTASTGHVKNLFYTAASKGGQRSAEIKIDTNGHLSLTRYGVTGGGGSSNSTIQINDFQASYSGSWIHLACICGADYTTRGQTAFYVNGVSQSVNSESPGGGTAHVISGAVFVMSNGHQADSHYFPFQGKYDEVSYWKAPLTAVQVIQLYNCGTKFNLTGASAGTYLPTGDLTSWWTFDDTTITGSMHTGFTITDHAATFGANTLTVKDKYQEAGSGILLTPVSGVINAKPMALFSLKTSTNTAAYNGETTHGITAGFVTSSAITIGVDHFAYLNCTSSLSGTISFTGGINDSVASRNLHSINDSLLGESKNRTIITSRFSAPGGIEVQSKGYLDAYSHEYSVHNALPYRNLTVRGSGSGESGTIRAIDIHGNRSGLRTHLQRHSGKFGSDSGVGSVTSTEYVTVPSFHKIPRNVSRKPTSTSQLLSPVFNEDHNNAFFQSPIPQSDYQYSWVTSSLNYNYGIRSGKQRVYGYLPRDGELVNTDLDQSANFSSNTSFIEIGTDTLWNGIVGQGSSNRTMACAFWFKRTTDTVSYDYQRILSFSYRDLQLSLFENKFRFEADWSTTDGVWISKETFELNRWYHIVLMYDGGATSNDPVLYIDGALANGFDETATPVGSLVPLSGQNCYIGNSYFKNEAFRGNLDNFAIFSDGLSQANVTTLYNDGDRFREYAYRTNMELYYRMGAGSYKGLTLESFSEDTTSNFYDISGNGRNSTDAANLSFTTLFSYTVYDAITFPTASEIFGV